MRQIDVKLKKLHPDALVPKRATAGAACYDLFAPSPVVLFPNVPRKIGLGLAVELPFGWEMTIRPRSSLSLSKGILVHPGTVDSDYRGEIMVVMLNISSRPYLIHAQDRIAQAGFASTPAIEVGFTAAGTLAPTGRSGGFGSTGR